MARERCARDVTEGAVIVRLLILNWRDPKHPAAGGAETYLFEAARRWVASGHAVLWLTAGFRGGAARDQIDGVAVRRLGNAVTVYALAPLYYALRLRKKIDAVLDSENGIPFFSPLYADAPCVCVMHHVHESVFRAHLPRGVADVFVWLELVAMPFVYRRSTFVAVSPSTRAAMALHNMTPRPVPVVYNGVDPRLRPARKCAVPTILYLGRLKKYKRIDVLVRAMPRILNEFPDARLVLAGDGDQRGALERLVAELHLASSVEFAGFVDERRKSELLASAWIYASASSMEGWGIAIIEAGRCGTPAVVTDSPGLRDAVIDGRSGVLSQPAELANDLARVLRDAALRARLSEGALARATAFSWEATADALLGVLQTPAPSRARSQVRDADGSAHGTQ